MLNLNFIKNLRYKNKIKNLFNSYDLYFINLTFPDEYLCNSTYKMRFEFIKDYVSKYSNNFIIGRNFTDKEREYYVCISNKKLNYKEYPYKAFGRRINRESPAAYMKYFIDTNYIYFK